MYTKNDNLGEKIYNIKYAFDHLVNRGLNKVTEPLNADKNTDSIYKFELSVMPSNQTSDDIGGLAANQLLVARDSNAIVAISGADIDNAYQFFGQHAR